MSLLLEPKEIRPFLRGNTINIDGMLKAQLLKVAESEEFKKKMTEALNEYVGFPVDDVPRWVDWDLALKEIQSLIKEEIVK